TPTARTAVICSRCRPPGDPSPLQTGTSSSPATSLPATTRACSRWSPALDTQPGGQQPEQEECRSEVTWRSRGDLPQVRGALRLRTTRASSVLNGSWEEFAENGVLSDRG